MRCLCKPWISFYLKVTADNTSAVRLAIVLWLRILVHWRLLRVCSSLNKFKALCKSDTSVKKTVGDSETLRPNDKLALEIVSCLQQPSTEFLSKRLRWLANVVVPIRLEQVDKKTKRARPRISFPVPKSKVLKQEEDDDVNMAVQEERKYAIEAAIVRGMKMNRTMKMTELVHHVVRQLDYLFKADPKCGRSRPYAEPHSTLVPVLFLPWSFAVLLQ